VPLSLPELLSCLGLSLLIVPAIELQKWFSRRPGTREVRNIAH
jgi:hypothetical protein